MGFVTDMAQRAKQYVWGIRWGQITNDPYADVYTELQYIVPLRQAMREIMAFADEIDWTWDVYDQPGNEEALTAWYGVREGILTKDSAVMGAINAGRSKLLGNEAPAIELETWRAFVSQMFSLAMRSYEAHMNLIWQYGGADPALIVKNADYVHAMCQALRVLWDYGALNQLRKGTKQSSIQGLGADPIITPTGIVLVILGAAVLIYMVAYLIESSAVVLKQMNLADEICAEAIKDPTNRAKQRACRNAQKNLENVKPDDPFYTQLNIVAAFAGVGILVYVGSLVLPNVLEAWAERRVGD